MADTAHSKQALTSTKERDKHTTSWQIRPIRNRLSHPRRNETSIQLHGRYGPFETGSHIHEGTRQTYNFMADTAHSKQALTSTKELDKHTTSWQIRPIRNRLSHPRRNETSIQLHGRYGPFETGSHIHEGTRQAYNFMADTAHSKQALTSTKERDKHTTSWQIRPIRNRLSHPRRNETSIQLHGRYGPFETGSHIHEGTRQAYNFMADTAHSKQALTSTKERDKHTTSWQIRPIRNRLSHPRRNETSIQLHGRYGPFETGSHIHEGTRQAYNFMADTAHSKQALTSTKERDKHTTSWQIRPIRNRLSHPRRNETSIQLHGRYGPFETGSHIHEGTRQAYNFMADTAHSKQALTSTKELDKHTTSWQIRPIRNRLSHPRRNETSIQLHGRYGPFETGSHIHEGTRQAYNFMADTAHSKQALTSTKERDKHTTPWQIRSTRDRLTHPQRNETSI